MYSISKCMLKAFVISKDIADVQTEVSKNFPGFSYSEMPLSDWMGSSLSVTISLSFMNETSEVSLNFQEKIGDIMYTFVVKHPQLRDRNPDGSNIVNNLLRDAVVNSTRKFMMPLTPENVNQICDNITRNLSDSGDLFVEKLKTTTVEISQRSRKDSTPRCSIRLVPDYCLRSKTVRMQLFIGVMKAMGIFVRFRGFLDAEGGGMTLS
jgi:hypothetical protein